MANLNIFLKDLTKKAQNEVLGFYGYEDEAEGNLDIHPLFVLEYEAKDSETEQ